MLFGEAVMVNWSDVAVQHRRAYYEWHSREHMVGRVAIPGFRRGRRYIAAHASRDFLVCYEVANVDVLTSKAYLDKANAPSALTQETTSYVRNASRALARVRKSLGAGMGGATLTLRLNPEPDGSDALDAYLTSEALPALASLPEISGVHFCIADREASSIVPVERQGRPTEIPNWIVMVEGVGVEEILEAAQTHLSDAALTRHGAGGEIVRDSYTLQITISRPPS
jgi:hypothetical protein